MLPSSPHQVQLLRCNGNHEQAHRNVHVRLTKRLAPGDRAVKNRLPVTAPARTLVDLAGQLTADELLQAAACGLQNRILTVADVRTALWRMGTQRGASLLREVITDLEREGRIDSQFEREARLFLDDIGLPPHPGTFPLRRGGRILADLDIAYPTWKVCIECDGRRWHSLPVAFHADRMRWNTIQKEGWLILFLTYRQFHDPTQRHRFVEQLRGVLGARGAVHVRAK